MSGENKNEETHSMEYWIQLEEKWGDPVDLDNSFGEPVTPLRQMSSKEVNPTFSAEEFFKGVKRSYQTMQRSNDTPSPKPKKLKSFKNRECADRTERTRKIAKCSRTSKRDSIEEITNDFQEVFSTLKRIVARCIEKRANRTLPVAEV